MAVRQAGWDVVLGGALALAIAGCGTAGGNSSSKKKCDVPGDTEDCTCVDKTKSVRVCEESETTAGVYYFSACKCSTTAADTKGSDTKVGPDAVTPADTATGEGVGTIDVPKDTGPVIPTACGTEDLAILATLGENVYVKGLGCVPKCSGDNRIVCLTSCMVTETKLGFDCSTCLGAYLDCLVGKCAAACAAGFTEPACSECQLAQSCAQTLKACSGLVAPGTGCQPKCAGKQCGDDGCGGSCGTCTAGTACGAGDQCIACIPSCAGKLCGDNGCGGTCGQCEANQSCSPQGKCTTATCVPQCLGKECGSDGCDGTCGACKPGLSCDGVGLCSGTCTSDCAGKKCGSDGCNGTCGKCAANQTCDATGQCVGDCQPNCVGKSCGSNGCGGQCGTCGSGQSCNAQGKCTVCTPKCDAKECGGDGCGGSCGGCAIGQTCNLSGVCTGEGKACGAVSFVGCCSTTKYTWCAEGKLWEFDCAELPACGWSDIDGSYGCGTLGKSDPSGNYPKACP